MKKLIFLIPASLLILLILNSCEKSNCKSCTDNYEFLIGQESEFVNITTFDSVMEINGKYYNDDHEYFDVDGDGHRDFAFESVLHISRGGINSKKSSILVLNSSFQISVIEVADTLRICTRKIKDSTISLTFYNSYSDVTCSGDGVDSIHSHRIYSHPDIFSNGDRVDSSESWSNEEMNLAFNDQSSHMLPPPTSFSITRGNWNNQSMKYILFKKDHGGKNLYGWFRLSVDDYKEIRLFEYALQKNQ